MVVVVHRQKEQPDMSGPGSYALEQSSGFRSEKRDTDDPWKTIYIDIVLRSRIGPIYSI